QLRRGRLRESLARFKLDHFVMAFQAIALDEPIRCHRENPVMVIKPAILARPIERLLWIIGRVRSPLEVRRTTLPVVANRAAHFALLMRARATDEQVEPRMRCKWLIQSTANLQRDRLAPFGNSDEVMESRIAGIDRATIGLQQDVARLQSG